MPQPFIARSPAEMPDRVTLLAMSGLEFMQGMLAGQMPHPTISALMGYRLHSVAPGRVSFRGCPGFAHTNPIGAVHGGWYGTLLDSALGCAVMTIVPQGRWYTTLEYKVNITRALPLAMAVEVEGIVDHAGRSTAVAHATLRGVADGRLYASGSTTCIILA
ncbi:MAG: PaaI family thioesterase [Pseudorhodobacter sp.]|nr:PaaI family thioesterase [Pseudorhodobacter sp.]